MINNYNNSSNDDDNIIKYKYKYTNSLPVQLFYNVRAGEQGDCRQTPWGASDI